MGYSDLLTRNCYTPTDVILISNDAEAGSASATYVKVKEMTLTFPIVGSSLFRFTYEAKVTSGSHNGTCRLYKNGVAFGLENVLTTTYQVFVEEQTSGIWNIGDKLQLYVKNDGGAFPTWIKNFRILGTGSEFVNTLV